MVLKISIATLAFLFLFLLRWKFKRAMKRKLQEEKASKNPWPRPEHIEKKAPEKQVTKFRHTGPTYAMGLSHYSGNPIFIVPPSRHTVMSYSQQNRLAKKRRNSK